MLKPKNANARIALLMDALGCTEITAKEYLEAEEWSIEDAISSYYADRRAETLGEEPSDWE